MIDVSATLTLMIHAIPKAKRQAYVSGIADALATAAAAAEDAARYSSEGGCGSLLRLKDDYLHARATIVAEIR